MVSLRNINTTILHHALPARDSYYSLLSLLVARRSLLVTINYDEFAIVSARSVNEKLERNVKRIRVPAEAIGLTVTRSHGHTVGQSSVRRIWIRVREAAKNTLVHRSQDLLGHRRKFRPFSRECRVEVFRVQSVIERGLERRLQLSSLQSIPGQLLQTITRVMPTNKRVT